MENDYLKTIRTISIIVIVFSCFIVFGNGMGATVILLISDPNSADTIPDQHPEGFSFLQSHYLQLCFIMLSIGIVNIISGFGLRKVKNWGRLTLIVTSLIISLSMIIMTLFFITSALKNEKLGFAEILMIILSLSIFLIPFILLIRFLTKANIKNLFT
jgi:hypothetical protein